MIERTQERIDTTGEVFTPGELVNKLLDRLPQEVWSNPNKTWLEPTCGDGAFLRELLDRLMTGLQEWEPDFTKRHKHIIENMIFAVDLMSDNAEACVDLLQAADLQHNIVCTNGLDYDYNFGRPTVDGLFEHPAQRIFKIPGKNAWYAQNSG